LHILSVLGKDELLRLSEALTAAETTGLPYSVDESRPEAMHAPKPENRRRKIDGHALAAQSGTGQHQQSNREILDAKWEHVDLERYDLSARQQDRQKAGLSLGCGCSDPVRPTPRQPSTNIRPGPVFGG
jgi:hypothetical protein